MFTLISQAFSLDSSQVFWFITRAAGLMAYLLFWLSTVWGLAVSSKIFDRLLNRPFTFDTHGYLSLLALGFIFIHVVVLLWDSYAPFSVLQLLVPFTSSYRPVAVGLGIISLYLTLLVTVSFYLRRRIGYKTSRLLHYFSFLAYIGATVHGILAGTDTPLFSTQLIYEESAVVVLLLTAYWVKQLVQHKLSGAGNGPEVVARSQAVNRFPDRR
jgi:sulfoxide reductase heme-binding subunit YedZ